MINRLQPELLCFFVPESAKVQVEEAVQPQVQQMPKRWDWVVTPDSADVIACHQALSRTIQDLFQAWDVQVGDVVVDLTGATSAMGAALASACQPWTSRVISLVDARDQEGGEGIVIDGQVKRWLQGNPWDDAATGVRREACGAFNHGSFRAAATLFHTLEARVSGGQKPLYRALGDLALGYALWEQFHYRQAWEKLKTSLKALEMASLWGGPPGLKSLFLFSKRTADFWRDSCSTPPRSKKALHSISWPMRIAAPRSTTIPNGPWWLFFVHWKPALSGSYSNSTRSRRGMCSQSSFPKPCVRPAAPVILRMWTGNISCRCKRSSVCWQARRSDGTGLSSRLAQMKPLLDAANHAVLGHGFEAIKAERVQQLSDVVMKLTGVSESSLPKFPILNL